MLKPNPPILIVIGVASAGKTTLALKLSEKLHLPFFDADDFHPETNKIKMASGEPLTDDDRMGWLNRLQELLSESQSSGAVLACSALKESYRQILMGNIGHKMQWIFLHGSIQLLSHRIQKREGHFMPESLLQSQFDILEVPAYGLHLNVKFSLGKLLRKSLNNIEKPAFGLAGIGVMGTSLARNLARNGVKLSLYNRRVKGEEEKVAKKAVVQYEELKKASPYENLPAFVKSLQLPRKIFMMIPAGKPTGDFLEKLLPLLQPGDVVMDGGNSHYLDTLSRIKLCKKKGINFLGIGVSGGEKGALEGPAIMPGGNLQAYRVVAPYLKAIAATDKQGKPCVGYLGEGGSGHFVKMVHNGIEYAEMQLIAEWVQFFTHLGLNYEATAKIFERWQQTEAESYLLDITVQILRKKEKGNFVIDDILDQAGNKGTGNWTTVAASHLGEPATVLTAALYARYISAFKSERTLAESVFQWPRTKLSKATSDTDKKDWLWAYQSVRWVIYHQGLQLLNAASKEFGWRLNLAEICRIWTNGCIIRSALMEKLVTLADETPLLLTSEGSSTVKKSADPLRKWISENHQKFLPVACTSAAYEFIMAFAQSQSSAHIIQAQRDFFGAHGFYRKSDGGTQPHHVDWDN